MPGCARSTIGSTRARADVAAPTVGDLAVARSLRIVAGGAAIVLLLPPRAQPPAVAAHVRCGWPVVRGAYHVHSARSDGTGTLDEIAAAAARAGLQFVVLTDHGDGTRAPEPPAYRSGVLCIDGVEISTDDGHYVALGLPQHAVSARRAAARRHRRRAPLRRLWHSPRIRARRSRSCDGRDWEAPFDGLEWLNADSEWRDEFWGSLGRVLLTYAVPAGRDAGRPARSAGCAC